MTQGNINSKNRGFTIVELLVVIVVIGILAAITIVSYTGITAKANTSANKQNASSVVSVAQIVYANTSAFPTPSADAVAAINASADAKLPAGLTISNALLQADTAAHAATIQYLRNAAGTGICVGYWDYSLNAAAYVYGGTATAGTNATQACV